MSNVHQVFSSSRTLYTFLFLAAILNIPFQVFVVIKYTSQFCNFKTKKSYLRIQHYCVPGSNVEPVIKTSLQREIV